MSDITVHVATVPTECVRCKRVVFPFGDIYRIGMRTVLCSGCFHSEQSKRRAAARKRVT